MYSRTRVTRLFLRFGLLAFLACSLEPRIPIITRLDIFACGNPACTLLGAQLRGLPPLTGLFMVGAWFKGTQDVHWSIRWPGDSVKPTSRLCATRRLLPRSWTACRSPRRSC